MEICSPSDEDLVTTAFSVLLCTAATVFYLLIDFHAHEPLFYIFLGISCCVLLTEYGETLLTKVFGAPLSERVKSSTRSTISSVYQTKDFLITRRREESWTKFWMVCSAFVFAVVLGRRMDDNAIIYAACMLFSSSPIWKRLVGQSAKELANKASKLFEPPASESAELADYMPNINEGSQDLSLRFRRNSWESNTTDRDLMELGGFNTEVLPSLDTSVASAMNESLFVPISARSYGRSTDDDSSPIPSDTDFEIIEADDIPENLEIDSIQSGRIEPATPPGEYSNTGTLRRSARIASKTKSIFS